MKNKNIFKLSALALLGALALAMVSSNAMAESKRKPVNAAGVINTDGTTVFAVDENFISTRVAPGVYLIEVDARVECRFRDNGDQAALGPRLATPVGFPWHTSSPIYFVPSDSTGVCNDSAVYIVQVWDRFRNMFTDAPFSFQITGIKDKRKRDDD